jgi:uncharacterized protein YjeT (DUF2065 family)
MWHDIAVALCLVFVIEGMMPFISPGQWRKMVFNVAQMDDRSMRIMGLVSMVIGIGLLYLVN